MAKKKTSKATAKKKAAAKSTEEKKKTTTQKTSAKKTSTAQKTSTAKKSKKSPSTKTKETANVKKTKVTIKELLNRKFEKPDNISVEPSPKRMTFDAIPEAPPFIDTVDAKERGRLKALLMKKIDITDIPPKPKPKKNVPIAELIRQKYALKIESLWEPPKKERLFPDPPPYFPDASPEQQSQIRALLLQKISLKDVQPKKEPKKDRPVIPVSELIKKTYTPWTPQPVMPAPKKTDLNIPDPPPIIEGSSEEVHRVRKLLFKKIDMTNIPVAVSPKSETASSDKQTDPPEITKKIDIDPPISETPPKMTMQTDIPVGKPDESGSAETDESVETLISPEDDSSDYTLEINNEPQLISNSLKCIFAGIVVLFTLLYMFSSSNHERYYLVEGKTGVEIWQGIFSPMGKSYLLTLKGMEAPQAVQPFYTKSELYPLISDFYLDQASEVLAEDNIPNLFQVKEYLEMAHQYATADVQETIQKRLNGIDFMMFVLRADLAIQKGSKKDLAKAKAYIEEAEALAEKNYQKDMIKNRLQLINEKAPEKQSRKTELQSTSEKDSRKTTQDQNQKEPDSH